MDLVIFKGREEEGDKKTYKELLDIMKRHIARVREDKSMAPPTTRPLENRALQLRSLLLQHLTRVMTRTPGGRADKPAAPNPKAKPKATPALPSFNPKSHNGKGGKPRSRSSSREKAKTFCHYHFNQGNCKHGDECPYSHSKYHWDKKKKTGGKGKGKSRPPG